MMIMMMMMVMMMMMMMMISKQKSLRKSRTSGRYDREVAVGGVRKVTPPTTTLRW